MGVTLDRLADRLAHRRGVMSVTISDRGQCLTVFLNDGRVYTLTSRGTVHEVALVGWVRRQPRNVDEYADLFMDYVNTRVSFR